MIFASCGLLRTPLSKQGLSLQVPSWPNASLRKFRRAKAVETRCHATSPENSLNHTAPRGFCNICAKGDFHLKLLVENVSIFITNSCFPVDRGERIDVGDSEYFGA